MNSAYGTVTYRVLADHSVVPSKGYVQFTPVDIVTHAQETTPARIDRQRVKADINSQGYATLPIPAPPRNSLHPEPLPSNDNPNVFRLAVGSWLCKHFIGPGPQIPDFVFTVYPNTPENPNPLDLALLDAHIPPPLDPNQNTYYLKVPTSGQPGDVLAWQKNPVTGVPEIVLVQVSTAANTVLSVNGEVGNVILTSADVGALAQDQLDTDPTLAANSDGKVPSQKAVVSLVQNAVALLSSEVGSALSERVKKTELATVATTGDYDDLLNKPTIPEPSEPDYSLVEDLLDAHIENPDPHPALDIPSLSLLFENGLI